MSGVDEKNPPSVPLFDKTKYRYPTSKRTPDHNDSSSINI